MDLSLKLIVRHLLGEGLGPLTLRELKNLEGKVEKGISRVRTKKNELLYAEIEYLQKRQEMELHHNNQCLRAKIAESARVQQQMNLMPGGGGFEFAEPHSFDAPSFLQVMGLDSNIDDYHKQEEPQLQLM